MTDIPSIQAQQILLDLKKMIEENVKLAEAVKQLSALVRDQAVFAVELNSRLNTLEENHG